VGCGVGAVWRCLQGQLAAGRRTAPWFGACAVAVVATAWERAHADGAGKADKLPYYEISGGGEVVGPAWSAYASTTIALSAMGIGVPAGIREDGWRLRTGAGYWQYSDRPVKWVPGVGETRVSLKRNGSFADLLLGYHKSLGPLTVKAYGGVAYSNETWLRDGADDGSPGSALGAKVLAETWLNLTPVSFAQLDAGWTSLRNTLTARARLGYRITPTVSLGPEGGYWSSVDAESDAGVTAWRYGGFVRFEWNSGEISLSAGGADDSHATHFYATANALLRF
jgi:hypothetical protein